MNRAQAPRVRSGVNHRLVAPGAGASWSRTASRKTCPGSPQSSFWSGESYFWLMRIQLLPGKIYLGFGRLMDHPRPVRDRRRSTGQRKVEIMR